MDLCFIAANMINWNKFYKQLASLRTHYRNKWQHSPKYMHSVVNCIIKKYKYTSIKKNLFKPIHL